MTGETGSEDINLCCCARGREREEEKRSANDTFCVPVCCTYYSNDNIE